MVETVHVLQPRCSNVALYALNIMSIICITKLLSGATTTLREGIPQFEFLRYQANIYYSVFQTTVIQHNMCSFHISVTLPLQGCHNERYGVSNHQPHGCLFNHLFRHRWNGLCEGNSLVTGEFPAQKASNAENVSIWWRHHAWRVPCIYASEQGHIRSRIDCTSISPSS